MKRLDKDIERENFSEVKRQGYSNKGLDVRANMRNTIDKMNNRYKIPVDRVNGDDKANR